MSARSLRILIVSQFFAPEMGAPAARFHDFAQYFLRLGHRVTVLTAFPNFPSGRIHEAYRGRRYMTEDVDGIHVIRTWIHAAGKVSFAHKAAGYLSFLSSSSAAALLHPLAADVVIGTAPPPTIGPIALAAALRRRVPLIYDLRDLWPEAIVLSGRLRNPAIAAGLEGINSVVYRAAAAVTTVSDGKRDRLVERGVHPSKVHVIPNGVDLGYFDRAVASEGAAADAMLDAHGVPRDAFKVLYAGVMNPPQGLSILVEAAEALAADRERVHLVLVGNGSEREALVARARDRGITNVTFLPEQPRARIPALLDRSDASVVPLRPRRDTHTVPSKIFECMASHRPLVLSADAEPARIVREADAGPVSPAGDLGGLVQGIRTLAGDRAQAARRGERGRAFVERSYNREELNARFLHLVERLVRSER